MPNHFLTRAGGNNGVDDSGLEDEPVKVN